MAFVVAAVCMDLVLGDPGWLVHPVVIMGGYITWFERFVRRLCHSARALRVSGFFLAVTTAALSYGTGRLLLWGAYRLHPVAGHAVNIFLMWTCIALTGLKREVRRVYGCLNQGDSEGARRQLARLVSRDTEDMDDEAIARAAIETASENASDGIIAPLFFLIMGGAPLGLAYKAVNTMDSMVGYKNDRYRAFGFFPAKLDDAANFLPSRLTGLLMILWAFLSGKDYRRGFRVLRTDHAKSESPNAGYPEAAAAGILGVTLGGPARYFSVPVEKKRIGEGLSPAAPEHIKRCVSLINGTTCLFLLVAAMLAVVWGAVV